MIKLKIVLILHSTLTLISCSLLSSQTVFRCSNNGKYIIQTTSGNLSGSCEHIKINTSPPSFSNVISWLGVPYAEPPTGENRFKKPVPIKKRQNLLNSKQWPNSCMQLISRDDYFPKDPNAPPSFAGFAMWRADPKYSNMSEDCLYLNIFIPKLYFQSTQKLPIMVYFHGGSTIFGSSAMDVYNPSTFVASTNTIVITVNYRLGVFGFFYLENQFPGNQALLDQSEALKWIQTNAANFNGDPNRITIYGQSAGAMLGGLHLFYKKSWPHFRNIILQSGSPLFQPLLPISSQEADLRNKEYLKSLNCESAECLLSKNSTEIAVSSIDFYSKISESYHSSMYIMTAFVPVIDGQIITQSPVELLKKGDFKKCPVIFGVNKEEGTLFSAVSGYSDLFTRNNISFSSFKSFVQSYFTFYPNYPQKASDLLKNSILYEYTGMVEEKNQDGIRTPLLRHNYFAPMSKIQTDQMFLCPTYRLADLLVKHNPQSQVFMYLLDHRVSSSPWPEWYGTTHSDELAFVFGHVLSQRNNLISVNPWANSSHIYSNEEKDLTLQIFKLWSNFASLNNPNNYLIRSPRWPRYTLADRKLKVFKTKGGFTDLKEYSLKSCAFWNYYLPKVVQE